MRAAAATFRSSPWDSDVFGRHEDTGTDVEAARATLDRLQTDAPLATNELDLINARRGR